MPDSAARLREALADRYTLERELGRGGMATVYLATDLKHQRQVALKVLRPELAAVLGGERFLREITLTAGLHHPHILPLLDSGTFTAPVDPIAQSPNRLIAEHLFYTMPFVQGESLRDRLQREKQLPVDEALRITREVADALEYAHRQGIIHRDIKPENILLEGGHALVADFGIARAVSATDTQKLTETGLAIGTPGYMSPEQATATKELDGRSDIYSLGCVLYEMLVGEVPFAGPSAQAILARKLSEPLQSVSVVREAVPPGLEAAIRKALARVPADRYQNLAEFRAALESEALASYRPAARARRLVGPKVTVTLMAAAGLAAIVWFRWGRPRVSVDPHLVAVMPFQAVAAAPEVRELARQLPTLFWMQLTGEFGPRATDPVSVVPAWEGAGGTPEAGLAAAREMELARRQGAGRLVTGKVTGAGDRMVITASLIEVPGGAVRVAPVSVRSAANPAGWLRAVDSLIGLLLAKDANEFAERVAPLAHFAPDAVQAYLAGLAAKRNGDYREAGRLYDRALAADSNFVLAALAKYDAGEADRKALDFAWEHRDQLAPRERAYLTALAADKFGTVHTHAEIVAQWDSVTRAWPEWATAWTNFAFVLLRDGSLAGIPRWRERAWAAVDSADRLLGGSDRVPVNYGWALAMSDPVPDTARQRLYTEAVVASPMPNWANMLWAQHWRLAASLGDTAEAHRWLAESGQVQDSAPAPGVWQMILMAIGDGRGLADADRMVPMTSDRSLALFYARVRGQYARYVYWRDSTESPFGDALTIWRVQDALFLGVPEDSAARASAKELAEWAAEEGAHSASRCWSTVWALRHGDGRKAGATAKYLREGGNPVCAGLIEVLLADLEGSDRRAAVLRWDSIVHPAPLPGDRGDWTHGIDNLLLARLLVEVGDTAGALAASRRRYAPRLWWSFEIYLPDLLREEGRLAAMMGDTAGATRAYNHYLALRENADGPWRAVRDSVRAELAALVSR
jgi:tetratricopeptide (TPR) repeat protein